MSYRVSFKEKMSNCQRNEKSVIYSDMFYHSCSSGVLNQICYDLRDIDRKEEIV